mmetsp:Transcript_9427/g.18030  ORF Transcript_9427/g.18030 Transcript_9427/m.18030 type:complete len:575 (+) Transcript_9427:47-1771(+)|eukprot:scaffold4976_cov161-Amphora_coffeaeformis.AAC.26
MAVAALTDPPDTVVPESFAWLCLGLVLVASHPREISAWSALALFCRRSFLFHVEYQNPRRRSRRVSTVGDEKRRKLWKAPREQGLAILILTSLWALSRPVGYSSYAWVMPWALASRQAILSWIVNNSSPSPATTTYIVACLGLFGLWCHTAWKWYAPGKMLVAHFLSDTLTHATALHQVFSIDEWATVSFLAAGAWLEWMEQIVTMRQAGPQYFSPHHHPDRYTTLVACAGNIGVVWAASWVGTQRKTWPLALQMVVLLVLPLVLVEISLVLVTSVDNDDDDEVELWFFFLPGRLIPRCIQWLMNFLLQTEDPIWNAITPFNPPRLVWLVYWAVVATAGLVAAPTRPSRVVTRKWFHAVAVLLFTPVTLYAPVLQSLGYAVAVAVLVGLEGLRPSWPFLQRYYARYLDPAKDGRNGKRNGNGATNAIIVSHTALILGCAMPLWCYQMADARLAPIVPFGGIVVLGVGDALGAVIGKWYGRNAWTSWIDSLPKHNRRTLEGSLAMWIGQMIFVAVLGVWGIPVEWIVIGPPILFATIVEAWTSQMDNLLLPLAVTAFYGLWEQMVDSVSPSRGDV